MSDAVLGLGISGLLAAKEQFRTIGHNIANSTVEGYSKQVTQLVTNTPQFLSRGFIGRGVHVGTTRRVVDDALVNNLRTNLSLQAERTAFVQVANHTDNFLADANSSLSRGLEVFFNALSMLNNTPTLAENRQVFYDAAQGLAIRANGIYRQLNEQTTIINQQIDSAVTNVNTIASALKDLNANITAAQTLAQGAPPNDLLDQRDSLLNQLAELVQVQIQVKDDDSVNVYIGQGQPLILGNILYEFGIQTSAGDTNKIDIVLEGSSYSQVVTDNIIGGKLGGLTKARTDVIDNALYNVGRTLLTLGSVFNEQHKLGVDLLNALGGNFFNDFNEIQAQLDRSLADNNNAGTGVLGVSIDTIARQSSPPYQVFGSASNIVDSGSLGYLLSSGQLTINSVAIRATLAGDDTVSPATDSLASGIATAAAINASTGTHGVTASVQQNNLYLGTFSTGNLVAGNFTINGQNIVTNATSVDNLLIAINQLTATTGVRATADSSNNVTLIAEDGRNIELTHTAVASAADFSYFNIGGAGLLAKVQRAGVTLSSNNNSIVISGGLPSTVGLTAGTTPSSITASILQDSSYTLEYDGVNYLLTRNSDDTLISSSTTLSGLIGDGFTIELKSGTMFQNDRYLIRPTLYAARDFALEISDLNKIAIASPVQLRPGNNQGTVRASTISVTDTATIAANTNVAPLYIKFTSPTTYQVFDTTNGLPGTQLGPDQTYDPNRENVIFPLSAVVDLTAPGPNAPYNYDPGFTFKLSGVAETDDNFTVYYNSDAPGDNRNGLELAEILTEKLVAGYTTSLVDSYGQVVAEVGLLAKNAKDSQKAADALVEQSKTAIDQVSGVDLNEQAVMLMHFQQLFQASAEMIKVARENFASLIAAFR